MGAELLHADGRTDMLQLIVGFRDFANAPDRDRCSPLSYSYCAFDLPVCVGTDWKRSRYRRKECVRTCHSRGCKERNTGMRRITIFRSTADHIYDGGPIIL